MIRTPLSYRWPRAQQIAQAGQVSGSETSGFRVQGTQPEPYTVKVEFDGQLLAKGSCTCLDFVKMSAEQRRNPMSKGLPLLRDVLVCKHILAAALQALADDEWTVQLLEWAHHIY